MDKIIDLTTQPDSESSSDDWIDYSNSQDVDIEESSHQWSESSSEESAGTHTTRNFVDLCFTPVTIRRSPRLTNLFPINPLASPKVNLPLREPTSPKCVICFENKDLQGFRPCLHVAVCRECTKKIDQCPMCRRPIDSAELYVKPIKQT